jgi:hypothetical protein
MRVAAEAEGLYYYYATPKLLKYTYTYSRLNIIL